MTGPASITCWTTRVGYAAGRNLSRLINLPAADHGFDQPAR